MKNHLENWLTWPEKNEKTVINIYPMFDECPKTLKIFSIKETYS